jgi:hypothetical protein
MNEMADEVQSLLSSKVELEPEQVVAFINGLYSRIWEDPEIKPHVKITPLLQTIPGNGPGRYSFHISREELIKMFTGAAPMIVADEDDEYELDHCSCGGDLDERGQCSMCDTDEEDNHG